MYEESKGFKTSLVGGFNREDVLEYIERTATQSGAQIESLRQSAEELAQEMGELREKNEALSQKNADLLERLGEMTVEDEKLQQSSAALVQRAAQDADELRRLREQVAALESEKKALAEKSVSMEKKCADYEAAKENLTEMELAAHRRAKEVEERAEFSAKRVRIQSAEVISQLKKDLTAVCDSYRAAAAQAKQLSAENGRRADEMQTRLCAATALLDVVVVGELSASAEENAERPRMQRVLDSLRRKEGE